MQLWTTTTTWSRVSRGQRRPQIGRCDSQTSDLFSANLSVCSYMPHENTRFGHFGPSSPGFPGEDSLSSTSMDLLSSIPKEFRSTFKLTCASYKSNWETQKLGGGVFHVFKTTAGALEPAGRASRTSFASPGCEPRLVHLPSYQGIVEGQLHLTGREVGRSQGPIDICWMEVFCSSEWAG